MIPGLGKKPSMTWLPWKETSLLLKIRMRLLMEPMPVALVTQWQQYRDLDYGRILENMMRPAYLFDGRNHLDHQYLFNLGYNVFPLGSAPLTHL
jgi:hypothetical protein